MDGSEAVDLRQRADQLRDYERSCYAYFGDTWGLTPNAVDARFTPDQRDFYYLAFLEREQEAIDHQILAIMRGVNALFSKDATPPFVSARYLSHAKRTAIAQREFPYDVSFLPTVQIHALVAHSVQYRVTETVFEVAKTARVSAAILRDLTRLQQPRQEGIFRVKGWFTEAEFLTAIERVLGRDLVDQHRESFLTASQQFPRCPTAVWTPARGQAALGEELVAKRAAMSEFLWEKWEEMAHLEKPLTLYQVQLWRTIEQLQDQLMAPAWFVDSLHLQGSETARRSQAQAEWDRQLGESLKRDLHQQIRATLKEIQASLSAATPPSPVLPPGQKVSHR